MVQKKKKSKKKTKRLSRETIKIVVNNYLNNRDLRKQRKRQAQKKRNPSNKIGSQYPIQNKAIDSYSYLNSFRHTNDTRLMALEKGISNSLTTNIALLNDIVRQNRNIPLLENKPHFSPPSQDYKNFNPNYPDEDTQSIISGFSVDADELENLKKDFDIEEQEGQELLSPIPEQKSKKGGGKSFRAPDDLLKEKPKKEKLKLKDPSTQPIAESPSKDYGKRPTQQQLYSFMPDNQVIDKAKFYDLPKSEMDKFTSKNRDGETVIKTGQLRRFKEAILKRAREVTAKPRRGRNIGS